MIQNDTSTGERVVVTGGAGFVGSHLVRELIDSGYHVVIIDDLSTGNLKNVEELLNSGNATFVHGSVTDLLLLRKIFQNTQYVFHQAVAPDNELATSHEVSMTGTLEVLVAARDCGISKVLYASPLSESDGTPMLSDYHEIPMLSDYHEIPIPCDDETAIREAR